MSKTIIITTDEMKNILNKYFDNCSSIDDLFCLNCYRINDGNCIVAERDCPHTKDETLEYFVNTVFANYMIPFS